MIIREAVWLEEVEEKIIRKHNVLPEEAEDALRHRRHVRFMEHGHRRGEDVYAAFGQTEAGRYLVVCFILKLDNAALILTPGTYR